LNRREQLIAWLAALLALGCFTARAGWVSDGVMNIQVSDEVDPIWAAVSNDVATGVTSGRTAFAWGNHAVAGYATGTPLYVETDPLFSTSTNLAAQFTRGHVAGVTNAQWIAFTNWVAGQGYVGASITNGLATTNHVAAAVAAPFVGTKYLVGAEAADNSWRWSHDAASTQMWLQVRLNGVWTNSVRFLPPGQ
jgi:hypothetical protein